MHWRKIAISGGNASHRSQVSFILARLPKGSPAHLTQHFI
jgi:hypothetical protein